MKSFEIKKEIRYCPICEEEHEVILKKEKRKDTVKECEIEYEVYFYVCSVCNEEFEDGEILDRNLMSMRDAYRTKNGLLTTNEIIKIREKYKLTQSDLAIILGLGEKTIARYETSTIQDKPYDILLRQFSEDYNFAYDMLIKSKDKFKKEKYDEISNRIKGLIQFNTEEKYNEMQLKNKYIFEDYENSKNGYRLLNIPKIKSMIAYFARYTKELFTVKLMKLFWYCDVLSYRKTGHSMTGLVYTHMPMGALPIGYREICELNSVDREPEEIFDNIVFRFVPTDNDMINESLFSLDELSILQNVCNKFEYTSGNEISTIMHEENIYKLTEEKQILDFSLINEIKAFK